MKKFLSFALIGLLVAGLFVSCSSDVEDEKISYGLCSVDFDANSKGLQVTVDGNLATSGSNEFFWSYTATKLDSYGKEGEKTSITKFYNDTTTKGLAKLENLSTGKWKFELFAFLDGARSKQVYDGSIEVVLSANVENSIAVPMKRSQIAGKKGTLVIDPAKVNIAYDAGTVVVTNEDGESYVDEHALKQKFGVLSDYSYWVYECDEDWKETTTLTNTSNKETYTTKYTGEFEPGVKYIKIKLSENGKKDANVYLAMLKVNIYSNCITEIQDDGTGEDSGIVVKRLKEFKITYYEGKEDGYTSDEKREVGVHPLSEGIHSNVVSDYKPSGIEAYPKYHQYGRTELLDVPTRDGYGFVGWYKDFACTDGPVTAISAYSYTEEECVFYAKWGQLQYISISWDNNFPVDYKGVSYDGKNFDTSKKVNCSGGSTGATIEQVKASDAAAKSPTTNPVCPGYNFKGWYYDDITYANPIMTAAGSVLPLPEAQIALRTFKAKWEPVRYKIEFHLNSSTSSYCPTDAKFGTELPSAVYSGSDVSRIATIEAEFGVVDVFNDAISSKKGFLGWSLEQNATTTAKCVDNDNIMNVWTDSANIPTNGSIVKLYAVWSEWFVPVEYIRNGMVVTGITNNTSYIDTKIVPAANQKLVLEAELSGNFIHRSDNNGYECFFGVRQSSKNDMMLGVFGVSDVRNDRWAYSLGTTYDWGSGNTLYFEDKKYKHEINIVGGKVTYSVDGNALLDSGATTALPTNTYYLFCSNNGKAEKWGGDVRIYSFNVYDGNGKLVHRFVPCRLLKTMSGATTLNTYCQDALVSSHTGDDGTAHAGELGMWDYVENKFYYNKGENKLIGPNDEYKLTLVPNNEDAEMVNRVQRIVKSNYSGGTVKEKIHRNIFSKANASFLGWKGTPSGATTEYSDNSEVNFTADKTLYANWSKAVSWQFFKKVNWIELERRTFIMTDQLVKTDAYYRFSFMYTAYKSTNFHPLFGARDSITDNRRFSMFTNSAFKAYTSIPSNEGKWLYAYSKDVQYEMIMDNAGGKLYLNDVASGTQLSTFTFPAASGYTNVARIALNTVGAAESVPHMTSADGYFHAGEDPGAGTWCRWYYANVSVGGKDLFNVIPAVLTTNLTSSVSVTDASGTYYSKANEKCCDKIECPAGTIGMWDIVNDVFYPVCGDDKASAKYDTGNAVIHFEANKGLGIMNDVSVAKSAATYTIPETRFERDGYEFIGWNTKADGVGGTWYSPGRILYGAQSEIDCMTLFAQWRKIENPINYTELDYIQNNGEKADKKLAYINTKINSTAKYRVVYSFMALDETVSDAFGVGPKWTGLVNAEKANMKCSDEIDCKAGTIGMWDIVNDMFYPVCGPDKASTTYDTDTAVIHFEANKALGIMEDVTISKAQSYTLPVCKFERDGFEFVGWNTEADGSGKWYSPERHLYGGQSEIDCMTLFAQWKPVDDTRSAYCEDLEYIVNDNDGSAYIDTGLKLTSTDMRILYTYAKKNVVDTNLLGSKDSVYSYNHGNMNGRDLCVGSAKFDVGNVLLDKKYNVEVSSFNGYLYYRHWGNGLDVSNSLATTIKAGDNTEYLFGVHTAGGLEKAKGVALYSVKYYDASDRLVRDFVPVILKTTLPSGYDSKGVERQANTIGMWDNVNNKFYANAASSGAFACSAYTSVVYNANGGRGTMDNQMFANNESHTLSANEFTRNGYSFVGWNTDKDGNGRWYCNGYSSDSWDGGALTLYAQWVSNDTISSEYFDVVSGVKSSGKEYIDLGFRPDASSSAVVTYGLDTECDDVIFGYSNASNSYRLYNKDGKVFFDINGTEILHSNNYNTGYMYSFEIGNFYLYSGDNPLASRDSLESFTANDNCYLFKGKNGNSTETVYALKVYQNGVLVRNLVPCRLKQDISVYDAAYRAADQSVHYTGEVGFWDFAEDVFYGNDSGRGSLLAK